MSESAQSWYCCLGSFMVRREEKGLTQFTCNTKCSEWQWLTPRAAVNIPLFVFVVIALWTAGGGSGESTYLTYLSRLMKKCRWPKFCDANCMLLLSRHRRGPGGWPATRLSHLCESASCCGDSDFDVSQHGEKKAGGVFGDICSRLGKHWLDRPWTHTLPARGGIKSGSSKIVTAADFPGRDIGTIS